MARVTPAKFFADNYTIPMVSAAGGSGGSVLSRDFTFTCLTTAPGIVIATGAACIFDTQGFITGDKLYLTQLAEGNAPGFELLALLIDIPDMDTASALVFQLGDSVAADTYMTTTLAGALGQVPIGRISSFGPAIPFAASTAAAGIVWGSLPKSYNPAAYATPASNDNLILTAQTGATTGITGSSTIIKGQIWYTQIGRSAL